MLVSKRYEENDIVSFKLSNGDEVIAKFIEETDTAYMVSKPVIVVPSQQGIGLMQAMFTGNLDKKVPLSKSHVMMHLETLDKIRDHYIQTTTGIQPVSKGGIIV